MLVGSRLIFVPESDAMERYGTVFVLLWSKQSVEMRAGMQLVK